MNKTIFNGSVQLLGWSDTHNGGPKLVLQLESSEDLEAFKHLTVKNGKIAGQLLGVAMVLQNPEPEPVVLQSPLAKKPKGGALSELAGLWCGTARFQDWVKQCWPGHWSDATEVIDGADASELAAQVVRSVCNVGSRAELDHSAAAAALFNERFREPFMRSQGG